MTHIEELTFKATAIVTELGIAAQELSQEKYDYDLIQIAVDDANQNINIIQLHIDV